MKSTFSPSEVRELKEYLNNQSFPKLEADEEELATKNLTKAREGLRQQLLSNHQTLLRTSGLISEIIAGQRSLKMTLSIPGTGKEATKNFKKMREQLPELLGVLHFLIVAAQLNYHLSRAVDLQAAEEKISALIEQLVAGLPEGSRAKARIELKSMCMEIFDHFENQDHFPLYELQESMVLFRNLAAKLLKTLHLYPSFFREIEAQFQQDMEEIKALAEESKEESPTSSSSFLLKNLEDEYGMTFFDYDDEAYAEASLMSASASVIAQKEKYESAREQLAHSCLRLVISVAKKYRNKGLPLADLIQEGNVGLIKAVDKYERGKGTKFSSFATWWIRQGITRSLSRDHNGIYTPGYIKETMHQLRWGSIHYFEEHGVSATEEELAMYCGISAKKLANVKKAATVMYPQSLDEPTSSCDSRTKGDFIEDKSQSDPVQSADTKDLLNLKLASLCSRDRIVLSMHFGLDERPAMSYEEISEKTQLTRVRVGQIIRAALEKMRSSTGLNVQHSHHMMML